MQCCVLLEVVFICSQVGCQVKAAGDRLRNIMAGHGCHGN